MLRAQLTLQQEVNQVPLFGTPLEGAVHRGSSRRLHSPALAILLRQQLRIPFDEALLADPESFRDAPEAFFFLNPVLRLLQDTQNLVHAPDSILHCSRPSPLQTLLDGKVKQTGGTLLELKKELGSVLPDKGVRIVTLRKRDDSDADPAPAEKIQRPQGSPHAGWVRIKQQHHVRNEPTNHLNMVGGQGGPQGRRHVLNPCLMQRDVVEISLHDDQCRHAGSRVARPFQSI